MPIFEYKCPKCQKVEEILTKQNDKKLPICSKCNVKMEKQFSTFSGKVAEPKSACSSSCPTGGCCPTGSCCPNLS